MLHVGGHLRCTCGGTDRAPTCRNDTRSRGADRRGRRPKRGTGPGPQLCSAGRRRRRGRGQRRGDGKRGRREPHPDLRGCQGAVAWVLHPLWWAHVRVLLRQSTRPRPGVVKPLTYGVAHSCDQEGLRESRQDPEPGAKGPEGRGTPKGRRHGLGEGHVKEDVEP